MVVPLHAEARIRLHSQGGYPRSPVTSDTGSVARRGGAGLVVTAELRGGPSGPELFHMIISRESLFINVHLMRTQVYPEGDIFPNESIRATVLLLGSTQDVSREDHDRL